MVSEKPTRRQILATSGIALAGSAVPGSAVGTLSDRITITQGNWDETPYAARIKGSFNNPVSKKERQWIKQEVSKRYEENGGTVEGTRYDSEPVIENGAKLVDYVISVRPNGHIDTKVQVAGNRSSAEYARQLAEQNIENMGRKVARRLNNE